MIIRRFDRPHDSRVWSELHQGYVLSLGHHTEMTSLESQGEDTPRRVLWFKPMSWLGQIRTQEQSPAGMRDDKTANATSDHTHIPLPSLAPSIPCPDSDRCDTKGVTVPPLRRSAPAISRFCPVLGWRTMLHHLTRRAAESYTFSIPDRNALWSRPEDDLLVQDVAKHSTSDILFPVWSEVYQSYPVVLSSSANSVTGLLVLWWN